MARATKQKRYKLPTPPVRVMKNGIPGETWETKWRKWHKGIANAPAFPTAADIQRQAERLNSVTVESIP
jgi:hypothetical protein